MSFDLASMGLSAPRPNRASRRSRELGIDQSPSKLLGQLPPQPQTGLVQIGFGHNGTLYRHCCNYHQCVNSQCSGFGNHTKSLSWWRY